MEDAMLRVGGIFATHVPPTTLTLFEAHTVPSQPLLSARLEPASRSGHSIPLSPYFLALCRLRDCRRIYAKGVAGAGSPQRSRHSHGGEWEVVKGVSSS